jgi:hypothetical protein
MEFNSLSDMFRLATSDNVPKWQRELFKKYRDEVQVHSKGQLFYKIDALFPNENPLSKTQRILSFEPITKGSFEKGVSQLSRIFQNSSYTAQASDKTLKYVTADQFFDENMFNYYMDKWMNMALATDPNAISVVYPEAFIRDKNFEQIVFVESEDIMCYPDAETVMFRSREESTVSYEEEKIACIDYERFYDEGEGRHNLRRATKNTYAERIAVKYKKTVWHIFQKNMFYRLEINDQGKYEYEEYVLPNTQYPPVVKVGGLPIDNVYQSFLSPFIPFGNLALLQHSQHTAVNFRFSFPKMSEIVSDCDAPGCEDGKVECPVSKDYPDGYRACRACAGKGKRVSESPYKTYLKEIDTSGLNGGNEHLNVPVVEYYTPDVAILDYSKQEWRDYLEMAETAIHIQQKVKTGNVESAESKQIDAEMMHSFVLRVGKKVFSALKFTLQQLENMMNSNPVQVAMVEPISYAILTEQEAFTALNTILMSNAPDIIKGSQVDNFINKFVSQSSPVRKMYNILELVDDLLLKNDSQISLLKSSNIATAEQWGVHTYAYPTLKKMYKEDPKIFDLPPETLVDRLRAEMEGKIPKQPDLSDAARNAIID